jgi:hypothetical protein
VTAIALQTGIEKIRLPFRRLYKEEFAIDALPHIRTPILSDITIINAALEERMLAALEIADLTRRAVHIINRLNERNGTKSRSDG